MALIELDEYYPNYHEAFFYGHDIKNFDVMTRHDEKVGFVENILVDENSGRFLYLIINPVFWILGKEVLLPIGLAHIVYKERHVYVETLTKEQVKILPEFKENLTIDRNYEERVREIYRSSVKVKTANQAHNSAADSYEQEPYFYEINEQSYPNFKQYEERLLDIK
ncbi:MAG: PRC-barrel domain-containing protein [Cyanobacteriota bacterium]